MISEGRTARERFGRSTYALFSLGYAVFAVYGSLVPLKFRPIPLREAIARFSRIPYLTLGMDSRADLVSNILLFVPLGYFLMAALRTDRRGRSATGAAALAIVAGSGAFAVAIEFTQVFFPNRTTSLNDIMAESAGATIGVVLWLLIGRSTTIWLRESFRERERPALVRRLLLAYCVGFAISQWIPLDLTLNLGELARKYREGRIVLQPFGYAYGSWSAMVWDHLFDIVLNVPLGAAAVLLWMPPGARRASGRAFAFGTVAVIAVEIAQIFVNSRYADVTDIMKGMLGVAIGVWLAIALSDRHATEREAPSRAAGLAKVGIVVWTLVLVAFHLSPFDFSLDRERVTANLHQIVSIPFTYYYMGTEFNAFTQMMRKGLLALPLGVLVRLSWPDRGRVFVARLRWVLAALGGFCLLFAIELGQVFLPGRVPDVTDVIIGDIGILVGLWLAGLVISPLEDRAPRPRDVRSR